MQNAPNSTIGENIGKKYDAITQSVVKAGQDILDSVGITPEKIEKAGGNLQDYLQGAKKVSLSQVSDMYDAAMKAPGANKNMIYNPATAQSIRAISDTYNRILDDYADVNFSRGVSGKN